MRGTPIRCRSSTNNEDLAGFNGAGLYDSHTHRPDEGPLSETVRQVWSSLWTFRGTEEREFHRIDHLAAAMGVLVQREHLDQCEHIPQSTCREIWRLFWHVANPFA